MIDFRTKKRQLSTFTVAPLYWIATGASNWSDTANWSKDSGGLPGSRIPGSRTEVIFDGAGLGNCLCDVEINARFLHLQSGYTGTLDFADLSHHHAIGIGGALFEQAGVADLGNSTITCSGDFQSGLGITNGSSNLIMNRDGSSLNTSVSHTNGLYDLTIDGDVTCNQGYMWGTLTVNQNAKFTVTDRLSIDIGALANNGEIALPNSNDFILLRRGGVISAAGQWSGNGELRHENASTANRTTTFAPGTYQNVVITGDNGVSTAEINGDVAFNGYLRLDPRAGHSVTLNSNDNNLTFNADVDFYYSGQGSSNYNPGTGNIIISGGSNQSINFNGETIEGVILNKSGGIASLTGAATAASINAVEGSLDIDGQNLTTIGNLDAFGGAAFLDTPNTGLIAVGGNFNFDATPEGGIWNAPNLNITGTGVARFVDVTNSDASAGSAVDATDNCNDLGGNVNWNFT